MKANFVKLLTNPGNPNIAAQALYKLENGEYVVASTAYAFDNDNWECLVFNSDENGVFRTGMKDTRGGISNGKSHRLALNDAGLEMVGSCPELDKLEQETNEASTTSFDVHSTMENFMEKASPLDLLMAMMSPR